MDDMPRDVIIRRPNWESLEVNLDIVHSNVTVTIDGAHVQLGFEFERPRENSTMPNHMDSVDFSSSIEEEQGDTCTGGDEEVYLHVLVGEVM